MISTSVSLNVPACEVEAAVACGIMVAEPWACVPKYIPRAPITPAESTRTIQDNPFKLQGFDFALSILLDPEVFTSGQNLTSCY